MALHYCEGKNFADVEEIQDLLSLDAPPVDMVGDHSRNLAAALISVAFLFAFAQLWGLGKSAEEIFALGLQSFPDEFHGFKGTNKQKVECIRDVLMSRMHLIAPRRALQVTQASKTMSHKLVRTPNTQQLCHGFKNWLHFVLCVICKSSAHPLAHTMTSRG